MYNYYRFDAEQFLKDSRTWSEDMDKLKLELSAITEIGGQKELPSGGGVSDPTFRTVARREAIQSDIDQIKRHQERFLYAWNCLSDEDAILLTGFFFAPGYTYKFVDYWCKKHGSNRQYCYTARREAIEHFGRYCEEWDRV